MKPPRVDALTAFEKSELRATTQDVIDDADARVQITFERHQSTSVNLDTGATGETTTDDATVNAQRAILGVEDVRRSGGRLEVGDRRYLIDQEDLGEDPSIYDSVLEGSTRLQVLQARSDPLDVFWLVDAREA